MKHLAGAKVESYVSTTSMKSSVVGLDQKSGILSLAIAAHPDFGDTLLCVTGVHDIASGDLSLPGSLTLDQ